MGGLDAILRLNGMDSTKKFKSVRMIEFAKPIENDMIVIPIEQVISDNQWQSIVN
jgi:hypothetical protein